MNRFKECPLGFSCTLSGGSGKDCARDQAGFLLRNECMTEAENDAIADGNFIRNRARREAKRLETEKEQEKEKK